jgi:CheY-like chemotaxis protein/two-component sensor histidine kinase
MDERDPATMREEELRAEVARLREANRHKDEFLGVLSHELRNPLAPIRNSLWVLDHAEPGGAQARRAREVANRQVAQLTRLVDDLLDVTRIARGKIELRCAALDLVELVRATAEDHRAVLQDRGLTLRLVLPSRPVAVDGDAARLAQVIGNLLHNAAKYTPPGGHVGVALESRHGSAELTVCDDGAGLDAATLDTMFEPFRQARETLGRSEGGLGLGLAVVKGLVALHAGEVTATSAGPGRGTAVTVRLPLGGARRARSRARAHGAVAHPAAHRRVLVVDDNHDAAESLAGLVTVLGHDAEIAYDGPSALATAMAHRPDVVLCDLGLPGMDGYEIARRLRAVRGTEVRLVAVSGYAQPEDVARATEAGYDAHVAKPPDPRRIERLLS